jgi:hypothetical protein
MSDVHSQSTDLVLGPVPMFSYLIFSVPTSSRYEYLHWTEAQRSVGHLGIKGGSCVCLVSQSVLPWICQAVCPIVPVLVNCEVLVMLVPQL